MSGGMSKWVIGALLLFLMPINLVESTNTQLKKNDLDSYIEKQRDRAHIPGLSAAIVKNGETVWTGSYGWSRIDSQAATSETLFQLASVSKTVMAVAVMKVWEEGGFDLDEDINAYLPFKIVNPKIPGKPITARMLLTHTSTIRDNWDILDSAYIWGSDSPILLGQFLEDYLTPGGGNYNPAYNFYDDEPGTVYHYSNIGATLAAYLAEVITGIPFDTYCNLEIFGPLGMEETSWRLADLDLSNIAMPYDYKKYCYFTNPYSFPVDMDCINGLFNLSALQLAPFLYTFRHRDIYYPYGFYAYPDYPDGLLKTSASQLACFLNMFIQYGEFEGISILEKETVEEMRRVQNPDIDPQQGLIWHYKELSGWTLLGHSGADMGVATEMFFRPEDGVGVILLMNGDWSFRNEGLIMEIETCLFKEAEVL